ncbi:unnamed protein product [Rotaria sordida]|uniref:60S ribosomal protein L36 n=1 Tax=Rotaria sordida TaxID=392033 RepID=A0A819FRD2_9BILA|nr:unnamed protein product [Rotaria sordida]CAF0892872.1 unnamed protein product [Rotaria sordida]CAF0905512.1 unnamed protein product [Rotaria sordida]CAF0921669.1 unnamed protein product [Rotaria sordida]CAF0926786.1 unnamed protein product [Rotaria sordida]
MSSEATKTAKEPFVPKYEIATGLHKGRKLEKFVTKRLRPSRRTSKKSKRVKFVRDLVRELVGFMPYERRAMELMKVGRDKRALKYVKARLGSHQRAKKKRDELQTAIIAQRKGHK